MAKLNFDFNVINNKLKKKLVQGSVIPRPIAWVETNNSNGSINLAPFSYFNMFSPTIVGISFQGKKDTYKNILREKSAVIHSVSLSMLESMDLTSIDLDVNESEVKQFKLDLDSISKISMTTQFIQELNLDDEAYLVLLRISSMTVNESVFDKENEYILADKLDPAARLAGPHYAAIKPLNYKRRHL